MSPPRTIVTGFGPFGGVARNPSAWLAERSGRPHRVLEVSFCAVDAFLADLDPDSFDRLLMLGLAAGETDPRLRLESRAVNRVGKTPDVAGVVAGPGPIDPFAPPQRRANLFIDRLAMDTERWRVSVDAGDYLCNYALFRALGAFPDRRIGFVHVPPEATWPLDNQLAAFSELLTEVESEGDMPTSAILLETEVETRRLGARLAQTWRAGEIVALEGPLGAGKTTLARGLLEGLGWTEPVRSPTYNLVQTFPTHPPVCHVDLYRVESEQGIDLERYLDTHLCLIEWPDRLRDIGPDRIVTIKPVANGRLLWVEGPVHRIGGASEPPPQDPC
ncbi:MAG: tRNA (adenosine(37)-N6)-threonylcarbamoyltransferase complex ATPase subunit type 1 TsaE [Fimbriimonadaceae bacterium]|nr:tRNA (adenosine(37)-N6)-threonylcarbamoyltransferase complex ATPase subunit type 1 TsaE [Fimbriimonadaceae bacterium]